MVRKYFSKILSNKGMTLVESLVAVLILSLGLIPGLAIILVANSFSASIKNNLIAANLAQEGVEVVRAMRDRNWYMALPFDTNLADGNYRVQWDSLSLLPESINPNLKITSSGLYNYTTGSDTIYKRRVIITKVDPTGCNCEIRVVSEITWPERTRTKTITVESHLFNWR